MVRRGVGGAWPLGVLEVHQGWISLRTLWGWTDVDRERCDRLVVHAEQVIERRRVLHVELVDGTELPLRFVCPRGRGAELLEVLTAAGWPVREGGPR